METNLSTTKQQRDASMVSRYADGETLDSIGNSFNLTRERVRQIVKNLGGTSAEESRRKRMAARESGIHTARDAFLAEFGEMSREMASRGIPRPGIIQKLKALFPEIDTSLADDALRGSDIRFDKVSTGRVFSDETLASGVWYLLGVDLGLVPDPHWAATNLEVDLLDELRPILVSTQTSPNEIATIIGVIGAAQKHVQTHRDASITVNRYGELREEVVTKLGLVSRQGATYWPPTRQTVTKRFGSWNEALEHIGLGKATKGRSKGLLKYADQDYGDAMICFLRACSKHGKNPTFNEYESWVLDEKADGFNAPSGASIRNYYGTWNDAIRSVQE